MKPLYCNLHSPEHYTRILSDSFSSISLGYVQYYSPSSKSLANSMLFRGSSHFSIWGLLDDLWSLDCSSNIGFCRSWSLTFCGILNLAMWRRLCRMIATTTRTHKTPTPVINIISWFFSNGPIRFFWASTSANFEKERKEICYRFWKPTNITKWPHKLEKETIPFEVKHEWYLSHSSIQIVFWINSSRIYMVFPVNNHYLSAYYWTLSK